MEPKGRNQFLIPYEVKPTYETRSECHTCGSNNARTTKRGDKYHRWLENASKATFEISGENSAYWKRFWTNSTSVLGAATGSVAVYHGTKYVVTTKTFTSQINFSFSRDTLNSPVMITYYREGGWEGKGEVSLHTAQKSMYTRNQPVFANIYIERQYIIRPMNLAELVAIGGRKCEIFLLGLFGDVTEM